MTNDVDIPDAALQWQFTRASGPGGQHVNKTSTAVMLRVDIALLRLTPPVENRLREIAGQRLTSSGELVIRAEASRSQLANREAALSRLKEMIKAAQTPVKRRVQTRVSKNQKKIRGEQKKRNSMKKSNRRDIDW
jgi:ribosome-associated protein